MITFWMQSIYTVIYSRYVHPRNWIFTGQSESQSTGDDIFIDETLFCQYHQSEAVLYWTILPERSSLVSLHY